jgi:RimJ/RimL family protein N-acetyltransferase
MERPETPRLVLREIRPSDAESLHRLFSDPLLMRFTPKLTCTVWPNRPAKALTSRILLSTLSVT